MAQILSTLADKRKYNKIDFMFPETGKYSRDKYPKSMAFFEAGSKHLIRALFGANGSGKTTTGGTEFAYHLDGLYPEDWKGRRFRHPINAWGCAIAIKQLKAAMQAELLGDFNDPGTGLIRRSSLLGEDKKTLQVWAMPGGEGAIGHIRVRHHTDGIFDGYSECVFKTYEQGWQSYQGSNMDLIWLDEEPGDPKIHSECVARLRGHGEGTEGSMYYTFTPLLGYSTIYLAFLPNGQFPPNGIHPENPEKFVIVMDDDVPHLTPKIKAAMLEEWKLTDPNNIQARKSGIAAIGSGRVYPVDEEFIVVKPFEIPEFWPRAYGLDFGIKNFAVVWVTEDPQSKVRYIYADYKQKEYVSDIVHIDSIKARGAWIRGAADPSGGGYRDDGTQRINYYRSKGLNLTNGDNAIISGIMNVLNQFQSGSLKVFSTCTKLIDEIRVYRYDQNNPNKVADKQDDHELDALRYCLSKFDEISTSEMDEYKDTNDDYDRDSNSRDELTGY